MTWGYFFGVHLGGELKAPLRHRLLNQYVCRVCALNDCVLFFMRLNPLLSVYV